MAATVEERIVALQRRLLAMKWRLQRTLNDEDSEVALRYLERRMVTHNGVMVNLSAAATRIDAAANAIEARLG